MSFFKSVFDKVVGKSDSERDGSHEHQLAPRGYIEPTFRYHFGVLMQTETCGLWLSNRVICSDSITPEAKLKGLWRDYQQASQGDAKASSQL